MFDGVLFFSALILFALKMGSVVSLSWWVVFAPVLTIVAIHAFYFIMGVLVLYGLLIGRKKDGIH